MRNVIIAALSAGFLTATVGVAGAMPVSHGADSTQAGITLVADGCGPGFFRGGYGGCRPMRGMGFRGPRFRRGPVVVVRPGFGRGFGRGPGRGFGGGGYNRGY